MGGRDGGGGSRAIGDMHVPTRRGSGCVGSPEERQTWRPFKRTANKTKRTDQIPTGIPRGVSRGEGRVRPIDYRVGFPLDRPRFCLLLFFQFGCALQSGAAVGGRSSFAACRPGTRPVKISRLGPLFGCSLLVSTRVSRSRFPRSLGTPGIPLKKIRSVVVVVVVRSRAPREVQGAETQESRQPPAVTPQGHKVRQTQYKRRSGDSRHDHPPSSSGAGCAQAQSSREASTQ